MANLMFTDLLSTDRILSSFWRVVAKNALMEVSGTLTPKWIDTLDRRNLDGASHSGAHTLLRCDRRGCEGQYRRSGSLEGRAQTSGAPHRRIRE